MAVLDAQTRQLWERADAQRRELLQAQPPKGELLRWASEGGIGASVEEPPGGGWRHPEQHAAGSSKRTNLQAPAELCHLHHAAAVLARRHVQAGEAGQAGQRALQRGGDADITQAQVLQVAPAGCQAAAQRALAALLALLLLLALLPALVLLLALLLVLV